MSISGFKEEGWAPNFDLLFSVQDAKSGGFSGFGFNCDEFKTVWLHEMQAVATWNLGNHLSICSNAERPRKPAPRRQLTGVYRRTLKYER